MSGQTGAYWWLPRLLACDDLDATDTLIMVALAAHVDADDETFVGIERVAAGARCSYPTAKRRLQSLEERGYIKRTRNRRGDGNLSTYTTLMVRDAVLEERGDAGVTPSEPDEPGTRDQNDPLLGITRVSSDQGSPGRSLTRDHPGDPAELFSSEQPSDEQEPSSTVVDEYLGFDEFWQTYPKRKGRRVGKKATRQRWRKLNLEDRRAAYRAAVNYARACQAGETIPKDPERFIDSKRYFEDWLAEAEPSEPCNIVWCNQMLPCSEHSAPSGPSCDGCGATGPHDCQAAM